MAKYLDKEGLDKLIELIKTNFPQYDAEKVITSSGLKATQDGSATTVWASDGTKMDLSDYAALVADKYPFGISSFSSTKSGVIEVSATPITPTLRWSYKNEKHTVNSQTVSDGTTTKTVAVGTKTLTWDPVDISTRKTVTFTLTAKADENTKTDSKSVSLQTVHRKYYGVLDSADVPTSTDGLTACDISNSVKQDITVTLNNQRLCYMYPSYFTVSKITEQNNFDVTKSFDTKTTTINGVAYTCQIQTDAASTDGGFTYHFN